MPGGVPFQQGGSANITAGSSSSRIAIPKPLTNRTVHVANLSPSDFALVRFGDSTVTASATDTAILPFESMIFTVPDGLTHIAAIRGAAADVVLNITSGWSGYST